MAYETSSCVHHRGLFFFVFIFSEYSTMILNFKQIKLLLKYYFSDVILHLESDFINRKG